MGIFNEHSSSSDTTVTTGERGPTGSVGPAGIGYKLDSNGNYDIQSKNLVNVKPGTNNNDVVIKSQIQLLDSARQGTVVNDKVVVYSSTGSVHAQSLYLKDTPDDAGNSDEIRILTEHQSYENVHLFVPNLENCDGYGGRKRSEMVTSVDQTITGKKVFRDIEVPTPTGNDNAVNKQHLDGKLGTKLDKIITTNIDLNNKQLTNLGFDISNNGDVINLGFADQKIFTKGIR